MRVGGPGRAVCTRGSDSGDSPWLANTFVDGRLRVRPLVLDEYHLVNRLRGPPLETHLDVLSRRHVDVFLGVGVPRGAAPRGADLFTAAHLERAPGWRLVFRSLRSAVYLRANPRNRENLGRVAAWYAAQDVPLEPERGLDVERVIRERPDWAEAHTLLPVSYAQMQARRSSPDAGQRAAALELLGLHLAIAGAYESQLAIDREATAVRPRALEPRIRQVYALLRLDRPEEALAVAAELARLAPGDPRAMTFVRAANQYAERRRALAANPFTPRSVPLDAPLAKLPLLGAGG